MESQKNNQGMYDRSSDEHVDQSYEDGEINDEESGDEVVNPDKAKDETAMCIAELSIWKDQCKRISAEFENFKRRTERDQVRWAEMAKESLLQELLSFVDTFDMALQKKAGTDYSGADYSGIEMAYQSLIKLLQKHEVTVMKNVQHFDPEFHEAVMQVQSDKHQSGDVVDVLTKGFLLKDRVLRPAKVSVAV